MRQPPSEAFVETHQGIWRRLRRLVDEAEFYQLVIIYRSSPTVLTMRSHEFAKSVEITDDLIEVFRELKADGDDSAILVERFSKKCWLTSMVDADQFMEDTRLNDPKY